MRRTVFALGAIVLLCLLISSTGGAPRRNNDLFQAQYVPGEVLLRFAPSARIADIAAVRAELGADELHKFLSGGLHWRLGPGMSVEQAIARHRNNPLVQYIEPNYIANVDIVPNDPRFPEMWGLRNTGQTGGTAGADIDAVLAWNVSVGSPNVVVGDIDTGCDYNHPDLAANIWTNPGEVPGDGIDNDGNGYVDDIHGYDFVNNDGDPFDDNGHGTHTVGTIAAVGDNGIGVVGVGWNTKVMCVKFLDAGGGGSYANAVLAVDYTTNMGVALTSNSWGGTGYSQALYDAVSRANAAGILFVAAAGNAGVDTDTSPHYPSAFDQTNVVSVAATDHNDAKASFSNWGLVSVDLAAPGVDILSTQPGSAYGLLSGTSMACPHVAGTLALMRAVNPNIGAAQMKSRLLSSADDIPSMAGRCVSGGRLNAFFTIATPDTVPPGAITGLAAVDPGSNTMGLTWTATGDDGNVGTASYYEMRYSTSPIDDSNWASATRAGNEPAPQVAGSLESMEVRGLAANTFYYFAVKAFDEWGNAGLLSNVASGTTLVAPTGSVAPDSVEEYLYTGQEADATVNLTNVGAGTLDFTIPTPMVGEPLSVPPEPLLLGKDEPDPRQGDPVIENFGGPDAFGYRWVDSDEPGGPAFAWTDISTTGTLLSLSGDDATSSPIALGFNFSFYGNFFNSIRVCTNGWLSFTSASTAYSNQPLPNSGAPENLIAPFWDDLNPGSTNRIYFQSFGNRAIVQWQAVPPYSGSGSYTFQAIIDQSGAVTYQYLSMTGPLTSATIGMQNATKTIGLQVAFNQTYIHDNLAVRIAAIPQWLTAFPTSGRLRAGQSKAINLHMNASGLEGATYPGTVNIQTNDPLHPVLPVSVLLHVTGAPDLRVQPTSLAYGDVFVNVATPQTLIVANDGTDVLHVTGITPSDGTLTATPSVFDVAPRASQNVTVTWRPAVPGAYSGSVTIVSNDGTNPNLVVPVTGNGLVAPQMVYDPTSFAETMYTGQQRTLPLTVYNTGGSNLIVNASADQGNGQIITTTDADADGSGGPDGFGYRWKDSDASGGPTFSWVDISGDGTLLSLTGDDAGVVISNMGMTFPYYGSNFTAVRVNTNGWISFDTTNTSNTFSNAALPNTTLPRNTIALMWDDLYFRNSPPTYPRVSRAYWKYDSTNGRVIIQYKNVYNRGTTEDLNFEVLLYSSGKIVIQYQTMTGTLNSATVGIQNLQTTTPTNYLQMVYNATYLKSNLAIEISKKPPWLTVTPASATIPPGGNSVFNVKFDSAERSGGVLNGAIVLTNNLPETQRVPAQLTVIGVPVCTTVPASYAYGSKYVGYSHLTSFQVLNSGTDVLHVTDITTTHGSLTVLEGAADGEVWSNAAFDLPPGASRLFTLRWAPMVPMTLNAAVQVYSNDPVNPVKLMPVTGTAIMPPVATWSPTSFSDSLISGQIHHLPLTLGNTGGSDLTYITDVRLNSGAVVTVDSSPELKKDEEDTRPGILGSGGPDVYGYRWRDSDALNGPVFEWVDISTIGTPLGLNGDDQNLGPFPIGFDFPFYGQTFNSFRACTNGFLSFTSTSTSLGNYQLPSTSAPENLLAMFHDDMDFRTAGQAYYYNDGSRLIVSYIAVPRYSSGGPYTYQVILYPSGRIVFQYLTMSGTRLNEATIGIQNAAKNDGLTVVYNAAYVHNNLAVQFTPPAGWLKVNPRQGTVGAGLSTDLDVAIDSTGLIGGDYAAAIDFTTNDPANALFSVPVNIHVTGIPDIGSSPASLTFAMTYVGYSRTLPLTIRNEGTDVLHVTGVSVAGDFSLTGLTTPVDIPVYGSIPVTVTFSPSAAGSLSGSISITSDDPDENPFVVPLAGTALIPPVIGVNPTSFTESLSVGDVVHRTLTVSNTGGSDLTFNAGALTGAAVQVHDYLDLKKGEVDPRPGILGSGGPDTFGYKWKDSDEPGGPAFNWVDISGVGTPITFSSSDDSTVTGISMGGMTFPFYGTNFTTVNVCTNGWLSFTSALTAYSNQALPNSGAPENLLAAFWDDLYKGAGTAYYYNDGGSRFIVQYNNWERLAGDAPETFEVILYPDGRIVFQYLTVTGTLNSATVGIQNATRDDGLTVVYNAAYLHNSLAIEFRSAPPWLSVTPTSGTIPAGGSMDLDVVLDATSLVCGDYTGSITLTSNDPARPTLPVPVSLHVTGIPDIDSSPASLTFPMVYVGYSSTLPLTIKNTGPGCLHITGVTVAGNFSTSLTAPLEIPAYGSAAVTVTFTPLTAGTLTGSISIASDDPDENPFVIPLTGTALIPPVFDPIPPEIHTALPPGGSRCKTVTVHNAGGSDLVWELATNIISGGSVTQYNEPIDLGKDDVDPRPGILGSGGPDLFGYRWIDSDEAGGPVFDWVDITGVGTPITSLDADDEFVAGIPIGFSFPFYGGSYSSLSVSSNGWISFSSSLSSSYLTNYALPSTSGPPNMIGGFWDDLSFSSTHGSGRAYYYNDGSRFILSFVNVPHYSSPSTGLYTFQWILYPNGRVVTQYLSVAGLLNSMTIGIQNEARNDGLTVVFNNNYVHNGLAIQFSKIADWITCTPTEGTVPAGGSQDVTCCLSAAGLEDGIHEADLTFYTNDPSGTCYPPPLCPYHVPVTLNVSLVATTWNEFSPDTLNLSSNGNYVKMCTQLPVDLDPYAIRLSSVLLNDTVPALSHPPPEYGDANNDGITDVCFKFDRLAVEATLPVGQEVPVYIQGEVFDVQWWRGMDMIRTMNPRVKTPVGNNYYRIGSNVPITWDPPIGGPANYYIVQLTRNGGATWEELAANVQGTRFDWTATAPQTDNARIRVLAVDSQGVMGYDWNDYPFRIMYVVQPRPSNPKPPATNGTGTTDSGTRTQ